MLTETQRATDASASSIDRPPRGRRARRASRVLRAAELNGVYIPSLCSHKELTPFGGCRLCIVEIEGMRGYPLACSTEAQEGMKVLTDTATLREMRKEILQLILSEHPASCLVCDEQGRSAASTWPRSARPASPPAAAAARTTAQCELQKVVERSGSRRSATRSTTAGSRRSTTTRSTTATTTSASSAAGACACARRCAAAAVLAFKYRGPEDA